MRRWLTLLLILGVGLFVVRKTSLLSYAGTLWSQVKAETKNHVPTRFEIDRVRHEIASLEGDIGNMIRPIAEHMATIKRLKKDISQLEGNLSEQKTNLLTMTKDLEGSPTVVVYGGEEYGAERVRQKLQRDFESYKRGEANLLSQRKLLEAKETSLKATQEQLSKVIAKRREYEVRLAQLEADEETLQISRIGSKLQIDDSRATQIEAALADIEHRHNVQRAEIDLRMGTPTNDVIPVHLRHQPGPLDLNAIRQYLKDSPVPAQTVRN